MVHNKFFEIAAELIYVYCKYISYLFSPKDMGLLDPSTSDGRVIFFLPWEGKTIVGTTDKKCDVTYNPEPSEEEIQFILNEVKRYVNPDIQGIKLLLLRRLVRKLDHLKFRKTWIAINSMNLKTRKP